MANLGQKAGVFHVRFRFGGKQYKKSLKTRSRRDAEAALGGIERTIHNLLTGVLQVPDRVDPGDFIVSGGTLKEPRRTGRRPVPTLKALVAEYLERQFGKADSTLYTERVHLSNLEKKLSKKALRPCDQITRQDLVRYLQERLRERSGVTVRKERSTIVQLFAWARGEGYMATSPAEELPQVKESADRPPFRTAGEIEAIIERGGLDEQQQLGLWESLFLTTEEIASLLPLVRERAEEDFAHLLHVIPAYTGMRRGEVLRLCWSDISFEHGHVVARSRKQSRQQVETRRQIDLHPELRRELLAWHERRPKGQYVIGPADGAGPLDPDTANRCFWQPMRGTAWCLDGKKNWFKVGFHTYRHSFASNLAAAGVDQRIIDEWMGHQTEAMRRRYRHLLPAARKSAIERISLTARSDGADQEPGQADAER